MSNAELANLLGDALVVWGLAGRATPIEGGVVVAVGDASYTVAPVSDPDDHARWLIRERDNDRAIRANSATLLLAKLRSLLGIAALGPGLRVADPS